MVAVSTNIVEKLTLFSALPVQALLSQLESGFIAEPSDRRELQRLWETTSKAFTAKPPTRSSLDAADLRPTEGADPAKLEALLIRMQAYPPYDSHPSNIFNVKLSKLVTPQITVNLSRAARRGRVRAGMTMPELIDLAFESAGTPEAIVRQTLGMSPNGGALMFTSYDEDIRLHHPPTIRPIAINERDSLSPSFESICFPVGGGLPFAAAMRVQIAPGITRLILKNGIHRAQSLAAAGYEYAPLLVVDMSPLEVPDPFVDFPRDILLNPALNPPLITDFLDERCMIRLKYHKVLRTVRFNWSIEHYPTVLR